MNTWTDLPDARPSQIWRLIDLIYATGQHPEQWPLLLEAMVKVFAMQAGKVRPGRGGSAPPESSFTPNIERHLQQALALNRHIGEQFNVLHSVEPLLATLKIPLLIVDETWRVVYASDAYSSLMHANSHLKVDVGDLCLDASTRQAIQRVMDGTSGGEILASGAEAGSIGDLRMFTVPLTLTTHPRLCVIAWFSADSNPFPGASDLAHVYGLTLAEKELLDGLLSEQTYAQLAAGRGVTEYTVRSQVKQIFAKTGAHSRAELVQSVLCGPELLNRLVHSRVETLFGNESEESRRQQTLPLGDGNILGFAEYGPPGGRSVLCVHGFTGSRLQLLLPDARCHEQGIRLIIPDRPGIGLSNWPAGFSMRYWTDAVIRLLDRLGLERVLVVGNSMGGMYALALASMAPQRIERIALVSTVAELNEASDLGGMDDDLLRLIQLVRRAPRRVSALLMQLVLRDVPGRLLDRHISRLPVADQLLFQQPAFYEMAVLALRENLLQGGATLINDLCLYAGRWDFAVEDVAVPVDCWHGTRDGVSPADAVRRLTYRLPQCRRLFIPGETHMLLCRHWNTVLSFLLHPESASETLVPLHD